MVEEEEVDKSILSRLSWHIERMPMVAPNNIFFCTFHFFYFTSSNFQSFPFSKPGRGNICLSEVLLMHQKNKSSLWVLLIYCCYLFGCILIIQVDIPTHISLCNWMVNLIMANFPATEALMSRISGYRFPILTGHVCGHRTVCRCSCIGCCLLRMLLHKTTHSATVATAKWSELTAGCQLLPKCTRAPVPLCCCFLLIGLSPFSANELLSVNKVFCFAKLSLPLHWLAYLSSA